MKNYPSPFNLITTIGYGLTERVEVKLSVINTIGEEVAMLVNEEKPAGNYKVNFNASQLSSGIYFYTLRAGNFVEMKKMVLIK